ncbi:hypothetical protein ACSFA3_14800 [Variovorax sp. RHLX14]|uniref:hypothetical protein n=1 Tax=Variovorax sp. RHLX14 TaxID=1259731 RepID=UPI003F449190
MEILLCGSMQFDAVGAMDAPVRSAIFVPPVDTLQTAKKAHAGATARAKMGDHAPLCAQT